MSATVEITVFSRKFHVNTILTTKYFKELAETIFRGIKSTS